MLMPLMHNCFKQAFEVDFYLHVVIGQFMLYVLLFHILFTAPRMHLNVGLLLGFELCLHLCAYVGVRVWVSQGWCTESTE